ncbi:MAG: DUF2637 domain-containing protein [bacterium]
MIGQPATYKTSGSGSMWTDGAAIHPRFLRVGPWVLSLVVATLFVLSFATSYAALHDYALQLQFGPEFAIVFPLVLDAVISVLAVTVLLERALRRRSFTIKGWQVTLRWPTWPLCALWIYFGGSVAGNVAHAPSSLPAQLVASVPPISAALTFHLLLRLLDRAPALREIAETYEERSIEEKERAALRAARRASLRSSRPVPGGQHGPKKPDARAASPMGRDRQPVAERERRDVLSQRVHNALASGERVTGGLVAEWFGVSARTGRRELAALLAAEPSLAAAMNGHRLASDGHHDDATNQT